MAKIPESSGGVSTAYFGRVRMKWGHGRDDALARKATITEHELRSANVTCEILIQWPDFQLDEAARNPSNPSAAARAELMTHCMALLKRDESEPS